MLKRTVIIIAATAFFGGTVPTQTAQARDYYDDDDDIWDMMDPSWWADEIFGNDDEIDMGLPYTATSYDFPDGFIKSNMIYSVQIAFSSRKYDNSSKGSTLIKYLDTKINTKLNTSSVMMLLLE